MSLSHDDLMKLRWPKSQIERFEDKYIPEPMSGCWIWIGGVSRHGYGSFFYYGKLVPAHKASWRITYGDIPPKLYVLHKCDLMPCVNPNHLFLGTQKENIRDMIAKGRDVRARAYQMRHATHCKYGHEFTLENTRIRPNGGRQCITCNRLNCAKYYVGKRRINGRLQTEISEAKIG